MRHYHVGNRSNLVEKHKEDIENRKQTLIFFGVGSHNQNRKLDNFIKIICSPSRRILIHEVHMWLEVKTQSLWLC